VTHNFHTRVLLVFVGLIVLAQAGTTTAMYVAARRTAHGLAEQQLRIAERLVWDTLGARDHEYRVSLQALAADFAFREAVASHDARTISSALANQGARVGADVALLMNDAGHILASTDAALETRAAQPVLRLLNAAREGPDAPLIADFNGRLMQLVVVPVRAPDTVGWVGMGFLLRDFVAEQIKSISGADVTFLSQGAGRPPTLAASSIPPSQRSALDRQLQTLPAPGVAASLIGLQGEDYLTRVVALAGGGQAFSAILQLPEQTVSAPLDTLRHDLLWWAGPVTILCLIAAMFCARSLAEPVQALATAARNLTVSKRGEEVAVTSTDDVSSIAGALQTLTHRTQYDALTGLPNRSLFIEWLSSAISRAERERTPLAVVFLDLDGFRNINDTLGRTMGDLVLRKTAQRLLRCLRPTDVVARLGADEFVLILDGASQLAALQIVDRLMPVIAKPMESPGGPIRVTMRAGIAIFPDHSRDRETLLHLADTAKHESKSRKETTVVARAPMPDPSPTMSMSVSSIRAVSTSDTWSGVPWEGDDLATQPMKKIDIDTPEGA
jgi:diguanylate cyclase (GGDEF)-like protein